MLKPAEKAYCRALEALRRKDYNDALRHFSDAGDAFTQNKEFNLLHETTRLLMAVKIELTGSKDMTVSRETSVLEDISAAIAEVDAWSDSN